MLCVIIGTLTIGDIFLIALPYEATPGPSQTTVLQFGEIFGNCDDGRLIGEINTTLTKNVTIEQLNVTFSAVSLWPSSPEPNNFTVFFDW